MQERSIIGQIHSLGEDQPVERTMALVRDQLPALLSQLTASRLDRVYILGSGTSFYGAQACKYVFEEFAGIPTEPIQAFAFAAYQSPELLNERTLVLGFSTSGHTEAVRDSLAKARAQGAFTVIATAVPASDTAQAAHVILPTGAEDEADIPRTKAQPLGLAAMYLLAIGLGRKYGHLSAEETAALEDDLAHTATVFPQLMGGVEDRIRELAQAYGAVENVFVLGNGPNTGTAQCGALMITEMAKIHTLSDELENFLHGRFREVDQTNPFIILAPQGPGSERTLDFLTVTDHVGAQTVVLTDQVSKGMASLATHVVEMPGGVSEVFTPIFYITPLHMFGYYLALARGQDPLQRRYPDISATLVKYREWHGG